MMAFLVLFVRKKADIPPELRRRAAHTRLAASPARIHTASPAPGQPIPHQTVQHIDGGVRDNDHPASTDRNPALATSSTTLQFPRSGGRPTHQSRAEKSSLHSGIWPPSASQAVLSANANAPRQTGPTWYRFSVPVVGHVDSRCEELHFWIS